MTQRHKRESAAPQAPAALNDKGEALQVLLASALNGYNVEIGASLDEVVVTTKPDTVLEICKYVKNDPELEFDYLRCISVVDYEKILEVNYHLFSLQKRHKFVLKASVSLNTPVVPSVVSVWQTANWFEREGHDLFGVVFEGHPNLAPLLLYEGFDGFPGRKSFPLHDYVEW